MENNIPTAEDFLQDSFTISHFYSDKYSKMCCFSDDVQKAIIEFAKLHVKAQTKIILENVTLSDDKWDSILNAYPLTNIK